MRISWMEAAKQGTYSFATWIDPPFERMDPLDHTRFHPIHFVGTVQVDRAVGEVQATITSEVTYACSRCLDVFTRDVELCVTFMMSKLPLTREQEENDYLYVPEDGIDLAPYVQQELILALEFQPLCSQDCRGLCPVCGKNRNHESCDCDTTPIDPRLASLAEFFSDSDDKPS
nr:DUF177 domain-containing protein [Bacilli bacterium]